jgi:hypothetical protein
MFVVPAAMQPGFSKCFSTPYPQFRLSGVDREYNRLVCQERKQPDRLFFDERKQHAPGAGGARAAAYRAISSYVSSNIQLLARDCFYASSKPTLRNSLKKKTPEIRARRPSGM